MLPLIGWTTVRLVVFQKNDGRRHNSEMEPQGRTIDSPFHTRRRNKTFRLGKTTLRVRVHVQTAGLNAETKNRPASSRGGDFFLDIPFYRTSAISAFTRPYVLLGHAFTFKRHTLGTFKLCIRVLWNYSDCDFGQFYDAGGFEHPDARSKRPSSSFRRACPPLSW